MNIMLERKKLDALASRLPFDGAPTRPLKVAIVNNMPDAALVATYRQFSALVLAATGGMAELLFYHLPAIPRGDEAKRYLEQNASMVDSLYRTRPDALIVTGNEPRAQRLDEEPYWQDLARLVDWARDNTRATLWSCLAAHAAVLHLDGIERQRLPKKKHGVLACLVSHAGRSSGLPATLNTCHSRMNGIAPADLVENGYEILSEAPGGDVDIFAKSYRCRFIFLQGHPEYEIDSLMREYRRDTCRFLRGERDNYPDIPENYFDDDTVIRMENFRTLAERTRDPALADQFPAFGLRQGSGNRLASSASMVFASWLGLLTPSLHAV